MKKGDLLFEIHPRPFQAEAGRAAREQANAVRLNLSYTRVIAPIDGRVSKAEIVPPERAGGIRRGRGQPGWDAQPDLRTARPPD